MSDVLVFENFVRLSLVKSSWETFQSPVCIVDACLACAWYILWRCQSNKHCKNKLLSWCLEHSFLERASVWNIHFLCFQLLPFKRLYDQIFMFHVWLRMTFPLETLIHWKDKLSFWDQCVLFSQHRPDFHEELSLFSSQTLYYISQVLSGLSLVDLAALVQFNFQGI